LISVKSSYAIPNATQSWQFNSISKNSTIVGDYEIAKDSNATSLKLDGQGYLKEKTDSTRTISNFTISAWIKPDYSQGSPQFTVISKENAFVLSVNNNIPPFKKVVFSIFDGIKWDTVESNSTIPEEWTHLAVTYNSSSISIYVNGTLESVSNLSGIPTFEVNGLLVNKMVGNLTSNSGIMIGAYENSARNSTSNLFSGSLQDIALYPSAFSENQISHLYNENQPSHSNLPSTPLLDSTNLAVSNTNTTSLDNTTSIPITPSLQTVKTNYLLTESPELRFQYFTDQNLKNTGKHIVESHGGPIQAGRWNDKNDTLSIQVTDPSGNVIPIKSQFEKLREGKFDIKLLTAGYGKPGLYKVKVTLTKNGRTFTTENQFEWGLVSVNTHKSIYKTGEIANFTLVVLDNGGHSVCNANIAMNIINPSGQTTTLSSGNGITPESQCGLYDAQY
ncbi:MAG: LamG domain-containing protein, partial [Nitrosotalea sp.]